MTPRLPPHKALPWSAALGGRGILRLLLIAGALVLLAHRHGTPFIEALLPAIQAEVAWLDDTYRIERLYLDQQGADRVIRIVVGLDHCVVLEGVAHCGHPLALANASTLAGHLTMPLVLLATVSLAWPCSQWRTLMLRLLTLLPASAVMLSVDVPFVLWAALWSLHVDAFAPHILSPLLIWSQFLQGGGRIALALILACVTIACTTPKVNAVPKKQKATHD